MRLSWPGRVLQTAYSPQLDTVTLPSSTVWEDINAVEFRPVALDSWFLVFLDSDGQVRSDGVNSTTQRRTDWRIIEEYSGTQISSILVSGRDNSLSSDNPSRQRIFWPAAYVERFDNPGFSVVKFVCQAKISGNQAVDCSAKASLIVMEVES